MQNANLNNFEKVSKYKWSDDHKDGFIESLKNRFNSNASDIVDTIYTDINLAVDKILNVYKSSAEKMHVRYRSKTFFSIEQRILVERNM